MTQTITGPGLDNPRDVCELQGEVAELRGRLEKAEREREELRGYWTKMRTACNAIAWAKYDNVAYPRNVAMDVLAIGCKPSNDRAERAATDGLVETLKAAERARDLLRAECGAWRARDDADGVDCIPAFRELKAARAATDAAGAMGGA